MYLKKKINTSINPQCENFFFFLLIVKSGEEWNAREQYHMEQETLVMEIPAMFVIVGYRYYCLKLMTIWFFSSLNNSIIREHFYTFY